MNKSQVLNTYKPVTDVIIKEKLFKITLFKNLYRLLFLLCFVFCASTAFAQQKKSSTEKQTAENTQQQPVIKYGVASYYASSFHNSKTANGEVYDEKSLTAACNVLPVNTWIKVTNLSNNKSVVVKINDRLHPKNKRIVDLSKSAAKVLGYISAGITKVRIEVLPNFSLLKSGL